MVNEKYSFSSVLLVLVFSCIFINATDFLKEKPDFMYKCERKNDDFRKCFGKNLQHIFIKWKEGVTGTANAVPLDPMFVSKFVVIEDRENVAPIAVNIANITVTGLSEAKVNNVSINDKEYNFKLSYKVPNIRLDGTYTAFGQILLLRINTTGKMFMDIVNGQYNIAAKIKLRQEGNFKFFDLKSLQFRIRGIDNIRLNFDNLFSDKTLNDNTNVVFNENWRMFYQIFKPRIEQEINPVLFKHFKNVFDSVPANFFIVDVESSTNDL